MKIGLYFGSFNPIHHGHLIIAAYILNNYELEQIWFVVSPQNPLKVKTQLLDEYRRLNLVNLAIEDFPKMKSSNIEFDLPRPSFTINTLSHLKEKFPQHDFSLILGQDNLESFDKWKNYEEILKSQKLFVYPRYHSKASIFDNHPKVILTKAPMMEISSTFIRDSIKNKKDIRYFLHPKVWEEIEAAGLYRKLKPK